MPSCRSAVGAVLASPRARALAALAVAGAAAVAEAQSPADLTVSLSGPSSAQSGAAITFYATVTNVPVWTRICTFDPDLKKRICDLEITSADAWGVAVDVVLPQGFTVTAAAGPGFSCPVQTGSSQVRCSGAVLWAGDALTIAVSATAPTVATSTTFTATATADPTNAIVERSESNNVATQTVTVAPPPPPPPPLAELWAYEDVTPATFPAWQSVTFAVSIHNLGPVPANGFSVQMYTNLPAGIARWSLGGSFSCYALGGFTQVLDIRCTGSLAAYDSATLYLELKLSNNFTPSGTPFTLYGYLDSQYVIPESNEQNNVFTKAAIVQ